MTPKQYRAAIERLGLSQEAAGELLGASGRSGQNWAAKGAPPAESILLRAMLEGKLTQEDVERLRK